MCLCKVSMNTLYITDKTDTTLDSEMQKLDDKNNSGSKGGDTSNNSGSKGGNISNNNVEDGTDISQNKGDTTLSKSSIAKTPTGGPKVGIYRS